MLYADQAPHHPTHGDPSAFVEACGLDSLGGVHLGYANKVPRDDSIPSMCLYCRGSTGPYDPNDKLAFPGGMYLAHFIEDTDELTYLIRFQNIGNDTAFTVVVRDTLSPYLNPATLVPGAASAAYRFRLYGHNIAEWTFPDIRLPDSTTDPAASHGFLQFKIQQQPFNGAGTRIENSAAIWFDFNAPVRTNTVFHTIGKGFLVVDFFTGTEPAHWQVADLKVWPNPFSSGFEIELPGAEPAWLQLELYDLRGVRMRAETFYQTRRVRVDRQNLPAGMYLWRITGPGGLNASGKLIARD
jgi:hypothetical protein